MEDTALQWLIQQAPFQGQTLWLCDEHFYGAEEQLPAGSHHRYIGNRFDIVRNMKNGGLNADFSDFDVSDIDDHSLDQVVVRLCKEKPLAHHLINIAASKLKPGGQLLMAGHKNEGAKTLLERAAKHLGTAKATRKNGSVYTARLSAGEPEAEPLDTQNYHQLRPHPLLANALTKPGQFGWQKIDGGSAFLLEVLQQTAASTPRALLDVGCGYGYLTLGAIDQVYKQTPERIVMTDNNAAALISARTNTHKLPNVQVLAADVTSGVEGRFDAVLCNPPFHQGFALSEDLTRRFLRGAARHTTADGVAYFVVNAFIPIEPLSQALFGRCQCLANNRQFKVLALSEPLP